VPPPINWSVKGKTGKVVQIIEADQKWFLCASAAKVKDAWQERFSFTGNMTPTA
jgi:hypothetical protein